MAKDNVVITPLELRLYAALKRIASYQSPERMRRSSQKDWGVDYEECLEMAYENLQQEARSATKGLRVSRAALASSDSTRATNPRPGVGEGL